MSPSDGKGSLENRYKSLSHKACRQKVANLP
ncbi:hypothetical protein DM49_300 [Burkholderia mallei]|nr:hypothetical protein DM49_300 [Burkholderia mallei]KOT22219.1 hypothetical protein DM52_2515 [Burkholderia mallei]